MRGSAQWHVMDQASLIMSANRQYMYGVTYYMADGTSRTVPDTATTDTTIVLQVPTLAPH